MSVGAGAVTESDAVAAVNFKKMMRWLSLKEWVTDDKRTQFTCPTSLG